MTLDVKARGLLSSGKVEELEENLRKGKRILQVIKALANTIMKSPWI
jgi:hypothetical protein